jgi:putative endonuclease
MPRSTCHKRELGAWGEARALEWLQAHDYQILVRNFHAGGDEIDLVVWDRQYQELVFCEVKTRSNDDLGSPADAYDRRKMAAQVRAAKVYIKINAVDADYRFDLITVLPKSIEHYQNVTWP